MCGGVVPARKRRRGVAPERCRMRCSFGSRASEASPCTACDVDVQFMSQHSRAVHRHITGVPRAYHMGTSLIRNDPLLGPYSRTASRSFGCSASEASPCTACGPGVPRSEETQGYPAHKKHRGTSRLRSRGSPLKRNRGASLIRNNPVQDPTSGLCPGPYGGPKTPPVIPKVKRVHVWRFQREIPPPAVWHGKSAASPNPHTLSPKRQSAHARR